MKSVVFALVAGLIAVAGPLRAEEVSPTPPSTDPCDGDPPPVLLVEAEVGEILIERGSLAIKVRGQYIGDSIEPEVSFKLFIRNDCKYEFTPDECGSVTNSNGYIRIDDLVVGLAEAEHSIANGQAFERTFGHDDGRCCDDRDAFHGRVAAKAKTSTLAFSFGSSDPVSLSPQQVAQLRRYVARARDVIAHLRPKFEAFNAAPSDASTPVEFGPRVHDTRCRAESPEATEI